MRHGGVTVDLIHFSKDGLKVPGGVTPGFDGKVRVEDREGNVLLMLRSFCLVRKDLDTRSSRLGDESVCERE